MGAAEEISAVAAVSSEVSGVSTFKESHTAPTSSPLNIIITPLICCHNCNAKYLHKVPGIIIHTHTNIHTVFGIQYQII